MKEKRLEDLKAKRKEHYHSSLKTLAERESEEGFQKQEPKKLWL